MNILANGADQTDQREPKANLGKGFQLIHIALYIKQAGRTNNDLFQPNILSLQRVRFHFNEIWLFAMTWISIKFFLSDLMHCAIIYDSPHLISPPHPPLLFRCRRFMWSPRPPKIFQFCGRSGNIFKTYRVEGRMLLISSHVVVEYLLTRLILQFVKGQ